VKPGRSGVARQSVPHVPALPAGSYLTITQLIANFCIPSLRQSFRTSTYGTIYAAMWNLMPEAPWRQWRLTRGGLWVGVAHASMQAVLLDGTISAIQACANPNLSHSTFATYSNMQESISL